MVEQAFRPAVRLVSFPALAAEVQMTVSLLLQSCNRKPRNSFSRSKTRAHFRRDDRLAHGAAVGKMKRETTPLCRTPARSDRGAPKTQSEDGTGVCALQRLRASPGSLSSPVSRWLASGVGQQQGRNRGLQDIASNDRKTSALT